MSQEKDKTMLELKEAMKALIEQALLEAREKETREPNELLVPDNIKIESRCGDGDGLGIVFKNQKLCTEEIEGEEGNTITEYEIYVQPCKIDFVECKLEKVQLEDLKEGHTYFTRPKYVGEPTLDDRQNISNYFKQLSGNEIVYWADEGDVFREKLDAIRDYNFWKVTPQ